MKLDGFLKDCEDCAKAQEKTLMEIVEFGRRSALGQALGLDKVSSVADFKSRISKTTWKDVEPYAQAAADGEPDRMFPGTPEFCIMTSGTSGQCKLYPESAEAAARKSEATAIRLERITRLFPETATGKTLPLVNPSAIKKTKGGFDAGAASGVTLSRAPREWLKRVAFPLEAIHVEDQEEQDYAILRFAMVEDVGSVFSNNAGRLAALLETAEKRWDDLLDDIASGTFKGTVGKLVEKHPELAIDAMPDKAAELAEGGPRAENFWPNLKVVSCWLAGSVGRYVERLRPLLSPSTRFIDVGYGATEAKFNIPLEPGNPAGPLALNAGFFEFKPLDSSADSAENLLSAHELGDGKTYEIYCTTFSGLYRYAMKDIVRVAGFTGNTPNIVFESKSGEVGNICGEKLSPVVVADAVADAAKETGAEIAGWHVVPDMEKRRYDFKIEFTENNAVSAETFSKALEKALYGDGTLPYPYFRRQGFLDPATVSPMEKGWFENWKNAVKTAKSASTEAQLKLPTIVLGHE